LKLKKRRNESKTISPGWLCQIDKVANRFRSAKKMIRGGKGFEYYFRQIANFVDGFFMGDFDNGSQIN
jgi:hypothetical protein